MTFKHDIEKQFKTLNKKTAPLLDVYEPEWLFILYFKIYFELKNDLYILNLSPKQFH